MLIYLLTGTGTVVLLHAFGEQTAEPREWGYFETYMELSSEINLFAEKC